MNRYLHITHIGFDADDTLWINETLFRKLEMDFIRVMQPFACEEEVSRELFKTEMANMDIYGYGVKPFVLSVIETGLKVSNFRLPQKDIYRLINAGKAILNARVELLPGVPEVLSYFSNTNVSLILATKGDALDQERKLKKSGLGSYFDHVEVMSDKQQSNYSDLLKKLGISSENFLMIGNSVKSDILPVIEIGGQAVHIPFHTTWEHESADPGGHEFPVYQNMYDLLSNL